MIVRYTQTVKWQDVVFRKGLTSISNKTGSIKYLITTVWFLFIPVYRSKTVMAIQE